MIFLHFLLNNQSVSYSITLKLKNKAKLAFAFITLPKIRLNPVIRKTNPTSKSDAPSSFKYGPIIDSSVPKPNEITNWFKKGTTIFLEVAICQILNRIEMSYCK